MIKMFNEYKKANPLTGYSVCDSVIKRNVNGWKISVCIFFWEVGRKRMTEDTKKENRKNKK